MLFLSEKLKILQLRLRTSIAFVSTNAVGQRPKPTNKHKREDSYHNESSLSFRLLSDMLTNVSVIFSFENPSPMARYFKKKVILSPFGLVIFYSLITCEANNTRLKAE